MKPIPENHPLCEEFKWATRMGFKTVAQDEKDVEQYIAREILTGFTAAENLFKVRNAQGAALSEVGEMLAEGNVLLNAKSFEREREVHKHIGDYVLFMLGLFPEYIRQIESDPRRKESLYREVNCGAFIIATSDYTTFMVQQGKRSYRIVSEFTQEPYAENAPLFKKLSDNFLSYLAAMGFVKAFIERLPSFHCLRASFQSF